MAALGRIIRRSRDYMPQDILLSGVQEQSKSPCQNKLMQYTSLGSILYRTFRLGWGYSGLNSIDAWIAAWQPPGGTPFATPYDSYVDYWNVVTSGFTSNYSTQLASMLGAGFGWTSPPPTSPFFGDGPNTNNSLNIGYTRGNNWENAPESASNFGAITLAFANNSTATTQNYFILRVRKNVFLQGLTPYVDPSTGIKYYQVPAGLTCTYLQVDLVSTGTIAPGKTIGYGADIALPLPLEAADALTQMGNGFLGLDNYIPVIGEDLTLWLSANGLTLGTTNITAPT